MKNHTSLLITLLLFAVAFIFHKPSEKAESSEGNYAAEVLREIDDSANKLISLAEEFPADLYEWRPAEGVRSVHEVFTHIAGANYFFPTMIGYEIPDGVDPRSFEGKNLSKNEVVELLEKSFDHLRSAIHATEAMNLNEETTWFGGRTNTVRGVMLAIPRHIGEHQGQLIAYARVNDVIPPWSQ